ncbi:MAG: dockerin type I repeat-containing protein [Oscillospiraceae bacterium]|nr:dockerin type I repeat-containing protein [Oscillospiraceae bacterium]
MKKRTHIFRFLLALILTVSLLPQGMARAEEPAGSLAPVPTAESEDGLTWSDPGTELFTPADESEGQIAPVNESSGTIAPLAEGDAQTRQVYGGCYIMNEDGTFTYSDAGGTVIPSSQQPRVGETLSFQVQCNSGYRLQWFTVSRDSELGGIDITDTMTFYVDESDGDVYYWAYFAREGTVPPLRTVTLDVEMPVPGGSYSGPVPADAAPTPRYASAYRVLDARWYLVTDDGLIDPESFEPGLDYAVEITVAPNAGWRFSEDSQGILYLSNGEYLFGDNEVFASYQADGSLVLTSTPVTLPASEPGDINGDGLISAQDLLLLRKYLVGLAVEGRFDGTAADLNGDGEIDILDLVRLRKALGQ